MSFRYVTMALVNVYPVGIFLDLKKRKPQGVASTDVSLSPPPFDAVNNYQPIHTQC